LYAAGLTVIMAATVTGCNANTSSTSAGAGPGGSSAPTSGSAPASGSALDTVKLAAATAAGANSFTGTMSLQVTAKPGAASAAGSSGGLAMSATFAEQLHPSVLASVDVSSLSSAETSLPGGLSEITTPTTLYLKWSFLTQALHLTKPWVAIPVSAVSKGSGVNLGQVLGNATGSGPLTESQLLAGATSVRQVGTGSIDGVPVTEYTGTLPLDKAISQLSGSVKTAVQQEIAAAGFSTATFTVWIDGQHTVRKAIVTEVGKAVTETTTTTITSINQPVSIAVPASGQTSPLPSSDLGNLS
jgi:hypothetical protein